MRVTRKAVQSIFSTTALVLALLLAPGAQEVWRLLAAQPVAAQTSSPAPMLTPRSFFTMATATNGKTYAAGGVGNGGELASLEEYDPVANTWTAKRSMSAARYAFGLAAAPNGRVYAIGGMRGGSVLDTVEEYDPVSDTWTTKKPMPTPRLNLAVVAANGKIYAIGGNEDPSSNLTPLKTVEEYDPLTDMWIAKLDMPTGRSRLAAAEAGGKIYVVGGNTSAALSPGIAVTEAYDPAMNTWDAKTDMPTSRRSFAAAENHGKVYAIAGWTSSGASTVVEEYNPASNMWQGKAPLQAGRSDYAATTLGDGRIIVAGGIGGFPSNGVEIIDPGESVPPQIATFTINGGAQSTPSTTATLNLAATDNSSGVSEMSFSNDAGTTWSAWEAYAISKPWTLTAGDGSKSVSARVRDLAGNVSSTQSASIVLDTVAPSLQSVLINDGATFANTAGVNLTLATSGGPTEMSFSNDGTTWSGWQAYASSVTWSLTGGDGTKTVSARVRDGAGNVSAVATDTIVLDTIVSAGQLTINDGAAATNNLNVTVGLRGVDPGTGVTEMSFSNTNNGADWSPWEPVQTTKAWAIAPGGDGTRTVFARVKDAAGNVSPAFSVSILFETVAPTITSLTLNGGALVSTSTSVTAALLAADSGGSGLANTSFSNDAGATWSAWQPYAATSTWTLATGNGAKTVLVRVRDAAGNVSEAASAQITLDIALGADWGMTINDAAVWTNSLDVDLHIAARPGTARMQVSNDGAFFGAAWEPFNAHKAWHMLAPPRPDLITEAVFVRFGDADGNVISGSLVQDTIFLDTVPPTGSLAIASGTSIQSPARQLSLTASDALSGLNGMRISNRADFAGARWQPFASSASWDFNGGGTVYAQFRDTAGNLSPAYSQSLPGASAPGTSPTPGCSPRPPVTVNLAKSSGTLVATLSVSGANNGLRAVRFDTFTGASVDVGSQTAQSAPFAVSIPAGQEPTSLQFTVRRAPGATSATVRLVVIDGCGEWSTFVGGGPGAW